MVESLVSNRCIVCSAAVLGFDIYACTPLHELFNSHVKLCLFYVFVPLNFNKIFESVERQIVEVSFHVSNNIYQ